MKQKVWVSLAGDLIVIWYTPKAKASEASRHALNEIEWALRLAGAECLGDL